MRLAAIFVAIFAASQASAQSLGDAAQKERERREKAKAKGGSPTVVTGDDLKATKGALANDPKAAPAVSAPAPRPPATPPPSASATKEKDAPAGEEEWRRTMALARERLAQAEKEHEYWSSQHLAPNEYFVDENGKKVVGSAESLRTVIAQAKARVDEARSVIEALEEQARRANVPPGWLR